MSIPGVLFLGCCVGLLLTGCAGPKKSSPHNVAEPYGGMVLVTKDGSTYAATNIVFEPADSQSPAGANTPPALGQYSKTLISTIIQSWRKNIKFSQKETGKVAVNFDLHPNGSVSNIKVVNSAVGAVQTSLCELTVGLNAPYPPWPDEVKTIIGQDTWNITITFDYRP